jgi:hypothetical protein
MHCHNVECPVRLKRSVDVPAAAADARTTFTLVVAHAENVGCDEKKKKGKENADDRELTFVACSGTTRNKT